MKIISNQFAEQLINRARRARARRRVMALLCVVVLLFTMNRTTFRADAMEGEPTCGIPVHAHDETCIDEEGNIICGLEEHAHDDDCFQYEDDDVDEETGVEPVEFAVDEQELAFGDEDAAEQIDTVTEETNAEEQGYRFTVGDDSPVMLGDILAAVGLAGLGVDEVGQVVDDAHPEGLIHIEDTSDGRAIIVDRDFDSAELAIIAGEDFYTVTLLDAVVAPAEEEQEPTEVENEEEDEPEEEPEVLVEDDEYEDEVEAVNETEDEIEAPEETELTEQAADEEESAEEESNVKDSAEEPEEEVTEESAEEELAEEEETVEEELAEEELTEEEETVEEELVEEESVEEELPEEEETVEEETAEEEPADEEPVDEQESIEEEPADEEESTEKEAADEETVEEETVEEEAVEEETAEEEAPADDEESAEEEPVEEEPSDEAPAEAETIRYEVSIDVSEMTAPYALRQLMAIAEPEVETEPEDEEIEAAEVEGDEAPVENTEDAQADDIDAWVLDYDEQLLTVERTEDDWLVTPAADFESAVITVTTPAAEYVLTLENAKAEVEAQLYTASYDLSLVELPLSLPQMMADARDEEPREDEVWEAEYDDNLIDIDEAGLVTPVAEFDETLIAVIAGADRFEFTLLNYAEVPTQPALDLGLAVVTPADETLAFDMEATGTAGLLSEAQADVALAAVESVRAAEEPETETEEKTGAEAEEEPEAEPLPEAGVVTLESRTEYQAFNISLINVDAAEYEEGFNVTVTLPEALNVSDAQLYHVLEEEAGITTVEQIEVDDIEGDGDTLNAFSFTTDSLEAADTYVLSYTVDFEYAEYPFSIPGGSSIALSELFDALHIEKDVEDVETVEFSDTDLVEIAKNEDDWLLISLKPFLSEETLTVTFNNGDVVVIRVTDAQETLESPYDLAGNANGWVTDGTYLRFKDEDDNWVYLYQNGQVVPNTVIPEYAEFDMNITFHVPNDSTGGFQGLKRGDVIVYDLPDWIRTMKDVSGNIMVIGLGAVGTYRVNDEGKLEITFNDDFVSTNPYNVSTEVKLSGNVNLTTTTETSEQTTIKFLSNEITTSVKRRTHGLNNIDIQKEFMGETHSATNKAGDAGAISALRYKLTVFAGKLDGSASSNQTDLSGVKISDVFSAYEKYAFEPDAVQYSNDDELKQWITYDNVNATLYDYEGNAVIDREVKLVTNTGTNGQAEFRIYYKGGDKDGLEAPFHPDERIEITYNANIDKEMYEHNPRGPWKEKTDNTDEYSEGSKSSGSDINVTDKEGTSYESRSWVSRFVDNKAEVASGALVKDTNTVERNNKGELVDKGRVKFEKTWLWKVGDPDKQNVYQNSYHVSINEAPCLDIRGWTFTDDVGKNGQKIISDVVIYKDEAKTQEVAKVTLEQLTRGPISSGLFAGSTLEKIVYKFPDDADIDNYRVFYKAEYTNKIDDNKLVCRNSATLVEPDGDKDTYGVYESHSIAGATVTKKMDGYDVTSSTINWITTVDQGIDAIEGSVCYDILGWIRQYPKDVGNENSNLSKSGDDYKDHTFDSSTLGMRITTGFGETGTLTEGVDYVVELIKPGDGNMPTWMDDVNRSPYGYKVTFKRAVTGPIYLHYTSMADFGNVSFVEQFINHVYYVKDPAKPDSKIWGQAIHTYYASGTLDKEAEKVIFDNVEGPVVKWHISINTNHYECNQLVFKDTIPKGLDFDLKNDLQLRWIDNGQGASDSSREDWEEAYTGKRDAAYDSLPTTPATNPDNQYFTATYDTTTRELKIVLKDINHKKVEFNIYTHPTLEQLVSINNPNADGTAKKLHYVNEGKLYTDSGTQTNRQIAKSSAEQWITYEMLGKDVTYDTTTAPYAEYSVTVNPSGSVMAPETHRIIVKDLLASNSTLRLKLPEGLIVTNTRTNEVLTRVENLTGDLSASEYRLTINGSSVGTVEGFTLDVPDGTPLKITYKAYVPGVEDEEINLSNNVTLEAEEKTIVTRKLVEESRYVTSSGSASTGNRIAIRKASSADTTKLLEGARFSVKPLYDVLNNAEVGDNNVNRGEITTGKDGIGKNTNANNEYLFNIANFLLYEVKETEAPKGFGIPQDPVVGYFVFITDKKPDGLTLEGSQTYLNWVQGLKTSLRNRLSLSNGKDIEIINAGYQDFEFFAMDAPSVDVRLSKVNSETSNPIAGARFRLSKRIENGDYVFISQIEGVTLDNSDLTFEIPVGGLTLKNLGYGTYRLVETKAPAGYTRGTEPIEFKINAEGKIEGLTNDTTIAVFDSTAKDGITTVKIPNTPGYALPSTGGTGTLAYTVGGLLLTLGAAILLLLKGRRDNY